MRHETCPDCKGKRLQQPCPTCEGEGTVTYYTPEEEAKLMRKARLHLVDLDASGKLTEEQGRRFAKLAVGSILRVTPQIDLIRSRVEKARKMMWWVVLISLVAGMGVGFLVGYVCR